MTSHFLPRRSMVAFVLIVVPAIARAQDTTPVRADSAAAPTDTVQVARIRVPPPIEPAWRYQIDFGFQDLAGNRDLTVVNTSFTVERRRQDRFILNFKLEARYGRSNGVESVNYQVARLRFDWKHRSPVSPFLGLDVSRDPIRKIAWRGQVGTGANINVDTRDASRTFFSFGFVQEHAEYTAGTLPISTDDTRWLFRAATTRLLGQTTRIESIARYQPSTRDIADYTATFEASVRVSLTRRMGLTTKFEFARDSRPATGVQTDDRGLSASLSFAW